ncbi:MAG: ABC transporter permease, partial [Bacilli bacterium]|nr:ABC transporter permease [Bacilli bacterium]
MQKIDEAEWELLLVFPSDFETSVSDAEKPEIQVYYNPNEIPSETLYMQYYQYLTAYEQQLAFLVYGDTIAFQVATESMPFDETQATGMMVAMLLPMLVLMFLFSGAMAIGPEAIAGEKERGTIATLLITPVKRSEIALGKVLGLSVLSLLSALSSFLGIVLSLPKMFAGQDIDMSIYTFWDYAQILIVLFSTVFVVVGIISIVSAYAKSMKEAGTMIMPFYILTIIIGITSMFGQEAVSNPLMYMIPLYNSVQTLIAVFTFDELSWLYMLITVVSNVIYLSLFIFLLNKMFKSEKIMFSK